MTRKCVILLCLCAAFIKGTSSRRFRNDFSRINDLEAEWGYLGDKDDRSWRHEFEACGGKSQSPVALQSRNATFRTFQYITFRNYDVVPTGVEVTNIGNGVTVRLKFPNDTTPSITSRELDAEYEFASMRFHWGETDYEGSEHTVDERSYPLEIQLMHYNKKYGSFDEARKRSDGLAGLSVMAQLSIVNNFVMDPIVSGIGNVRNTNEIKTIEDYRFSLFDMLPFNRLRFYRYQGSLTAPPCDENVIWTVFREPLLISSRQLQTMRQIYSYSGVRQTRTYRSTQPLNGRLVTRSFWAYFSRCRIPVLCQAGERLYQLVESFLQSIMLAVRGMFAFRGTIY